MKRIYIISTIACMAALTGGCAKNLDAAIADENAAGQIRTVSVAVSLPDETKTDLSYQGEGVYKLIWNEGDRVVLNGVVSEPLTQQQAGGSAAEFTVTGTIEAPYNVVYCGKEGAADAAVFPNCTTVNPDGLVQDFTTPLYASSNTLGQFDLLPLGSVLKITLVGESTDEIRSIAVQSAGSEKIAGEFSIGKSEGRLNGTLSGGTLETSAVSVAVEGAGVALDAEGKAFYISIPAGTYASGFNAYASTVGGKTMKLTFGAGSGIEIAPGKVYEFKAKNFSANTDDVIIATPADLVAFSSMTGTGYAGKKAYVINDIDMTGVSYSSVSYYGAFDGGNHTISGLTTSLFNELFGNAKNVTIDAEINYTKGGQEYGMGILAHYLKTNAASTSFVDNVTTKGSLTINCTWTHAFQAGGAVGASNGVSITNCTNYADIIIEDCDVAGQTAYFGGVLGVYQTAAATVENLTNYGSIQVKKATSANFSTGGVVGTYNIATDTRNIVNYGDVTVDNVTSSGALYPGGAVGYFGKDMTATDCINNGSVTVGSGCKITSYLYCGGIGGYSFAKLVDCTNNGDITVSGTYANNTTFGGLAGRTPVEKTGMRIQGVNNGKLTVDSNFSNSGKTLYLGGLVGHMQSGDITGENHGDIAVAKGKAKLSGYFIGGIVGQTLNNITGTASAPVINTGNITADNTSSNNGPYIGGIVGYWYPESGASGKQYTITHAQNSGKLSYIRTNSSTSDYCTWLRIGGIVAYLSGYQTNNASKHFITSCSNSGELYFEETLTAAAIAKNPSAGGIIAMSYGTKTDLKVVDLTISDCHNTGKIDRLCKGTDAASKSVITEDAATTVAVAGGIMGSNGGFSGGANENMYVKFVIENCTNSGDIRWNAWRTKGSRAETSGQGTMCYTGGIVGFGWGYASDHASSISCCSNSGRLNSNYGKNGGIIGFARGYTTIAGKKEGSVVTWCMNTGGVMYDSDSDSYTASDCLAGYAGGIAGYIFGDGNTVFRYCFNNGGRTMGNYGAGGFVGQMCSSGSTASPTIEYCKVNARSCASSGAKAYGLFAGQAAGLIWDKISNVAVGGGYKANGATSFTMATSENFSDLLVKNNNTDTQVAAAKKAVTDGRLSFWDGTTPPAWE